MFHEFGHALLSRNHISDKFANGYPSSIMCTNTCSNYRVYYQTVEMRDYFLDELFSRNAPVPDWVENENFVSEIFDGEVFDSIVDEWEFSLINDPDNLSNSIFFIEPAGVFEDFSLAINFTAGALANSAVTLIPKGY